jgi:arylsulfatase A-like enzyme
LGCFGCKDIPTPNIDSLARDGVRFTDAHSYNVCSPTRAALLTGCYAERNGIRTVLMGNSVVQFARATTVAKVLRDAGYATGLVGKWHLGYEGNVTPTAMGFDEFFGFHGGKLDYFRHTDSTQKNGTPEGKHDLWEGNTEVFRQGYTTDLFSERAVKFIRDHAQQPFFLELAYNAPHYAITNGTYQAPPAYLKKFSAEKNPNLTRGGYAAMVNCLDDGVGRVMAELRAQKLEAKTLVIFISDNGAEDAGSNGPLSSGKHSNKEGGIRVPWVARWPGVIPPGIVRADVVHVIDLMPTLLAVAQAPPPAVPVDGTNIWCAFVGKAAVPERALCFPPNAIRCGKWKMIGAKLFDLDTDLAEKTDVAAQHPEVCALLSRQLQAWQQTMKIKRVQPAAPASQP